MTAMALHLTSVIAYVDLSVVHVWKVAKRKGKYSLLLKIQILSDEKRTLVFVLPEENHNRTE